MSKVKGRTLDRAVPWQIHRSGIRMASVGWATLIVRDRVGWGPVRWAVVTAQGPVAEGSVYQGVEYQALVRQAMLEAETAARCDDCGRVVGHNSSVEH